MLTLGVAAYQLEFRFNLSPSIAPGVYQVIEGPIQRGAIVVVCLPSAMAAFARERDYISAGFCPDGNAPIGKRVAALAGDTVSLTAIGLNINGRVIPNTRPLDRDREGRALPRMSYGQYVVQAGDIWLVSTYSGQSFDSRYFGPVPEKSVISRVRPMITLP